MKARFLAWGERIDALSLRERTLLFLAAAAILVLLVNTLLLNPLLAKQKQLSAHMLQTQGQISAAQVQIQALATASRMDPNQAERAKLTELTERLRQLDKTLLDNEQGLVAPDRMVGLLQDILGRNQGLELISLKSLPVKNLIEPSKTETSKNSPKQFIYKHGVEVVVQGEYLDLLNYLTALEKLPWQMYWSDASLKVGQYPKSSLSLTLYTLSLDKKWLSV